MSHLLFEVVKITEEDNLEFMVNNNKITYLLYIIGLIFITILFIGITIYSYINIFTTYWFLKKSIHFIPYKHLAEDTTTRFILKKILET